MDKVSMDFPDEGNVALTEAFLRLLTQNDRWLAAYVYTLVPSPADADDILQDCKMVMWKQFKSFKPDTNFRAWARKIALYHILNHRRGETRRPNPALDKDFIEAVAAEIEQQADHLERRKEALQECLHKLPEAHRKVLILRYFEDRDIAEIATATGQSEGAVYRLLSRIRALLNDCVARNATIS